MFLAPFSIKKGSNIYGVIFASAHTLGIEKFLRICWEMDSGRGEANFDIDDEAIDPMAPHLFSEMDMPKKIQNFQEELRIRIENETLETDADVYVACLEGGMLPKHGREVLATMIKEGFLSVADGLRPRVSKGSQKQSRTLKVERK